MRLLGRLFGNCNSNRVYRLNLKVHASSLGTKRHKQPKYGYLLTSFRTGHTPQSIHHPPSDFDGMHISRCGTAALQVPKHPYRTHFGIPSVDVLVTERGLQNLVPQPPYPILLEPHSSS